MACVDYDGSAAAAVTAVRGTLPIRMTIAAVATTTKRIGQQTTTITELNETKRRHTCSSNAYTVDLLGSSCDESMERWQVGDHSIRMFWHRMVCANAFNNITKCD